MGLRNAELRDFKYIKPLYEDKDALYHWIFGSDYNETDDYVETKVEEEFGTIDEYSNYTLEEFEKHLSSILLYEENEEILGYFMVHKYSNGEYRIAEWAIKNPNDEILKQKMLEELLKIKFPRLQKFSVVPTNKNARKLFKKNGFETKENKTSYSFMYKILKEKSRK